MPTTITTQDIQNLFEKNGSLVLDGFDASNISSVLEGAISSVGLASEKLYVVAEEIYFILHKITSPNEAVERLVERLGVTDFTASELVTNIMNTLTDKQPLGALTTMRDASPNTVPSLQYVVPHESEIGIQTQSIPTLEKSSRERLGLRPTAVPRSSVEEENTPPSRPLTRDEVLRSVAPTRTMQHDIDVARGQTGV